MTDGHDSPRIVSCALTVPRVCAFLALAAASMRADAFKMAGKICFFLLTYFNLKLS